MARKLFIYHLNSIELFPPVMNFIRFIESSYADSIDLFIFTTQPPNDVVPFKVNCPRNKIVRLGKINGERSSIRRTISMLNFSLSGLVYGIFKRPDLIFYYETISCIPAIFLKALYKKKVQLYIHYHEYMNASDYSRTRFQALLHKLEISKYHWASWISHTNKKRMELFLENIQKSDLKNTRILPNYPSKYWSKGSAEWKGDLPLKFVYVGSLNPADFYLIEFLDWMSQLNEDVSLAIYTQSDQEPIEKLLKKYPELNVRIYGFVDYETLPEALRQYHVGLILYKAISENVIYSASNKLFEYLVCGLDVWLDKSIEGSKEYITCGTYPRVVGIDFNNLEKLDLANTISRNAIRKLEYDFNYEDVYAQLVNEMIGV